MKPMLVAPKLRLGRLAASWGTRTRTGTEASAASLPSPQPLLSPEPMLVVAVVTRHRRLVACGEMSRAIRSYTRW
jgi:hypothetical protein